MKSIKPDRLSDAIVQHIQGLVMEGVLPAGDKLLPERELAAKLDVSRPTLREALNTLQDLGIVTSDANGSTYISASIGSSIRDRLASLIERPEGAFDYLEFRRVMESEAAALAAVRASEPDREAIRRHFEKMRAANAIDDSAAHAQADADFHLAIYDACHNLIIMHLSRSLEELQRSSILLNRKDLYEFRDVRTQLLEEHEGIFSAIMARDPDAARAASLRHVSNTLATLREAYDAEKRLKASIRRLERDDLVSQKKPETAARGR